MSDAPILPDEAAALFRGPTDRFVADRDALAVTLRADGRDDDAGAVKALRKPTVVAWALNQLAVRDPDGIGELIDAGSEVRAAQQAALSSKRGAGERLRAAGAARKAAVARLTVEASQALAEHGGNPDAHAEAIGQAIEACATDPAAGALLAAGTLQRPPEAASGFGDMLGLTALEGGGGAPVDVGSPKGRSSRRKAAPRSDAELRADVARLRRDRDAARRTATKARSSADAFARELEGMRRRLEVVERKHAAAEAAASEGELDLARTERELRRAADALDADG